MRSPTYVYVALFLQYEQWISSYYIPYEIMQYNLVV